MMSLPPIYRKYAYQWRVSQAVLVYGLHQLDAWSCQECQCWVDYFLNVICYNYMLLAQKSNLLLLHVTRMQM